MMMLGRMFLRLGHEHGIRNILALLPIPRVDVQLRLTGFGTPSMLLRPYDKRETSIILAPLHFRVTQISSTAASLFCYLRASDGPPRLDGF